MGLIFTLERNFLLHKVSTPIVGFKKTSYSQEIQQIVVGIELSIIFSGYGCFGL